MRRSHGKTVNDTVLAEHDAFDSIIVGEHRDHDIAAASVRRAGGGLRALCDEFVRFRPRPVVDAHLMVGLQKVRRHATAHDNLHDGASKLATHEAVTNEGDCEELTYNHRISQLERDT